MSHKILEEKDKICTMITRNVQDENTKMMETQGVLGEGLRKVPLTLFGMHCYTVLCLPTFSFKSPLTSVPCFRLSISRSVDIPTVPETSLLHHLFLARTLSPTPSLILTFLPLVGSYIRVS